MCSSDLSISCGARSAKRRIAASTGIDRTQRNALLTSSIALKDEDSSRDLWSRCRFALHSRALVRKKAPRAATACPAAVPGWVQCVVRLALADTSRLPHYIDISFETRHTRFVPGLKAGACVRKRGQGGVSRRSPR